MRRRDVLATLGGAAAAWPWAARAQPGRRVIGVLGGGTPESDANRLTAFLRGLNEGGYVEGQNVAIVYHWAGGQYDRLPELLADLVHRQVKLIVASGGMPAALHARAATKTIPILFISGFDPVQIPHRFTEYRVPARSALQIAVLLSVPG